MDQEAGELLLSLAVDLGEGALVLVWVAGGHGDVVERPGPGLGVGAGGAAVVGGLVGADDCSCLKVPPTREVGDI